MSDRKADAPLSVEIPSRDDDRPAWGKVGVITAIGFVVGVGWPHVAGVRVGPSLPADALLPAASSSAAGSAGEASGASPSLELAARSGTPGPASAPAQAPAPAAAAGAARASVSVGHGAIFSCRTASDELMKGADCGTLSGLDGLVVPALHKLADCPAAAAASGKLHLTVRVDFGKGSLGAEAGKGSTVAEADGLVACAKTALADMRPTGIAHDNQRYGVSYHLTFAAPGSEDRGGAAQVPAAATPSSPGVAPATATPTAAAGAAGGGSASDSEAQVAWDVAIVRDAPRTGKIVAKLDRGTSVRVGAVSQGWYPVKYGDGFASEGWVYRGALGR